MDIIPLMIGSITDAVSIILPRAFSIVVIYNMSEPPFSDIVSVI